MRECHVSLVYRQAFSDLESPLVQASETVALMGLSPSLQQAGSSRA